MSNSLPQDNQAIPKETLKRNTTFEPRTLAIKVAGAAMFGALSIIISIITTESLPRMEWGIAFFDPVSIIWIISFLLFGYETGILTCVIGMFGLMPFDPTPFVGPVMKFVATIWLVLIPYVIVRFIRKQAFNSDNIRNPKIYVSSMLIAAIIRVFVMIGLNLLYITYVWQFPLQVLNLNWLGASEINGLIAVIITVGILNLIQSIFDSIIPYILVFTFKIQKLVQIY